MNTIDELIHVSATVESEQLAREEYKEKNLLDYFALAVTTFGVGYLPLAPGTWGSMVGVGIYLLFAWIEANFRFQQLTDSQLSAWVHAFNLLIFLAFCLLGIWAVVDEVIGQLLTFLFIPFTFSWKMILAGFLLFRLFDIWKPYPIDSLQNLPAGIGVCADDILAGVYAGGCLSILYALSLTL
jgi:phosphatidylglycerophosphatase A